MRPPKAQCKFCFRFRKLGCGAHSGPILVQKGMTQRKTISEGHVSHSAQPSPRAVEKVQLTYSFGALSHHIAAARTPIGHVHNVDNLTRAQPKHKNMINWDRASTLCATRNFQKWACKNFNECKCIREKERSRDKEKYTLHVGGNARS